MIRLAKLEDLPKILDIYEYAREFMRAQGNPTQWGNTHPEDFILQEDIKNETLYLIVTGSPATFTEQSTELPPQKMPVE